MKKFNRFLLIAFVGLCVAFGFAGINTLNSFKTYAASEPTLYVNLNLGEDISLKLHASIDDAVSAQATFLWQGNDASGAANENYYSDTVEGVKAENGTFLFTYKGIGAQYFGKSVSVTVEYDTATEHKVYAEKAFSVKDVLLSYRASSAKELAVSPAAFEALKVLSTDILNYGAAAQKYMNVDTSALVNDGLNDGTVTDFSSLTGEIPQKGDLNWTMGVRFDYNLQPMARFTSSAENLTATINGSSAEVSSVGNNQYKIVYKDFNILSFADEYSFEVFSNGESLGSATCSLSALAKNYDSEILRTAYTYASSVKNYLEAKKTLTIEAESDYVVRKKSDGSSLNLGTVSGVTFVKDMAGADYSNAYILFRVNAEEACEATLGATLRSMPWAFSLKQYVAIEINGTEFVFDKDLPKDENSTDKTPHDEWSFTTVDFGTVTLNKGSNTIKFIVKEAGYPQCPDFDKIELVGTAGVSENTHKCESACPVCGKCTDDTCAQDAFKEKCVCILSVVEAESDSVTITQAETPKWGGVVKGSNENGGYVKAENENKGSKITFNVTASKSGKALLRVYVAPRSYDYYFHNDYTVLINGVEYSFNSKVVQKDEQLEGGQWLARNYVCVVIGEVDLNEGENTIEFVQKGNAGTIMDKIDMISSTVTVTGTTFETNE